MTPDAAGPRPPRWYLDAFTLGRIWTVVMAAAIVAACPLALLNYGNAAAIVLVSAAASSLSWIVLLVRESGRGPS